MSEMERKFEKAEKEVEEKFKDFDPKRLTEDSERIHEVFVKNQGRIKFGALTFNDIIEVENHREINLQERGVMFIWMMLRKGYPDLKFEDVKKWDAQIIADMTEAFQKAGFFRRGPMPPSSTG